MTTDTKNDYNKLVAIMHAMGDKWEAIDCPTNEHWDWRPWIVVSDGDVEVHLQVGGYRLDGRLSARGHFKSTDFKRTMETLPKITMNWDFTPSSLAASINRRLVGELRPLFQRMRTAIQEHNEAEAGKAAAEERLIKAGASRLTHREGLYLDLRDVQPYCRNLSVSYDGQYGDIELAGVPIAQLEDIILMVRGFK